jgi:hypothetical protein
MNTSLEQYVKFVNENVRKYKQYTRLINGESNEITPQVVNTILAQYNDVLLMLIAEYNRKKAELYEVNRDYMAWWDDKFTTVRRQLNPRDIAASKWLSKQEVESETRNQFKEEYRGWQDRVFQAEQEKNLMGQLLEMWRKMDSIIITLSTNLRAEMRSLSLDSRLMYQKEQLASSSAKMRREKAN